MNRSIGLAYAITGAALATAAIAITASTAGLFSDPAAGRASVAVGAPAPLLAGAPAAGGAPLPSDGAGVAFAAFEGSEDERAEHDEHEARSRPDYARFLRPTREHGDHDD